MHWKRVALAALLLFLASGIGISYAQDLNEPDTIDVALANVDAGDHFGLRVRMFNDEDVEAISLGFWWNDPDLYLDSISWINSNASHIATRPVDIDNVEQNVLVGVIKIFEPAIQPGDSLLCTMWFTADPAADDQIIDVDSGFIPPAGVWKFNIGNEYESFRPQYIPGRVVIGDPQPPPVFVLSSSVFDFEAFVNGADPDDQVLDIMNGGGQTLDWTAVWDAPWLTVSPPSGQAPSTVIIDPSVSGLSQGSYSDTIVFSDPDATNSPQEVVVNFDVIIPPPIIELVPDNFDFLAEEGGPNPDPQTMEINDIGSGLLDWTASNSSGWLTLSAYSGTAGAVIDLNVDVTGLSYGTFYDTVVVSDPAATNNPQIAPVTLTVVSGFPIIELAPESLYVGATGGIDPWDRTILISNIGGDIMRYEITSANGYMSFDPDEDSVLTGETNSATVMFDTDALPYGLNKDTIVVSSATALNSPQRIPVTIWKMESPPILSVVPDPLTVNAWECFNWPPLGPSVISIQNNGAEYLDWHATWNAPWLNLLPTSGENGGTMFAEFDITGLAVGTYVDTVTVSAELAVNPPVSIEVILNVNEQTATPELGLARTDYEFIFKSGQVGTSEQRLDIRNLVGGCMSWYVDENTTWLDVEPDSGEVPSEVWIGVNGFGLPLGLTSTSFEVYSDEADNDPITVYVDLYIWTFGDNNCDGQIDIDDVVWDIMYIFAFGDPPCPRSWVGDLNCSHTIDIDDVTYLLNWIFLFGPPPCDYNPSPTYPPATHTFLEVKTK